MSRKSTIETDNKRVSFNNIIEADNNKIKSETLRDRLRQLIDTSENSGDLLKWDADSFLDRMKL